MSGTALRPQVVMFDVVETLASLDPVVERLTEFGMHRRVWNAWFTRLLRDGMALTAAGGYAGFAEVATSALVTETRGVLTDAQVDYVMAGFGELIAQPDAAAAVHTATEAGMRVFALTNGSTATTRGFLERAGLIDDLDGVLSIDEVRAWKPTPIVYEHALRSAEVPANRAAMIAVHSWDLYGARQVGFSTGWCSRLEVEPVALFGAADVTARTLDGVVTALAALPDSS